jgi:hypothetical protein
MKRSIFFILLLLSACGTCRAAERRILFVGFDVSATAYKSGTNPYAAAWKDLMKTVQDGDRIVATRINEKGLANGTPEINFGIRPYSILKDNRTRFDQAVQVQLDKQTEHLDTILKGSSPARGTEIIGFLDQAAVILAAYPQAMKQVVVFTDGIQEGEVDLGPMRLTDQEINAVVARERRAGRLPALNGISIWFVTGPSLHGQINSSGLLRLAVFWTKFVEASGGKLKAFSPVLANFDHDSQ